MECVDEEAKASADDDLHNEVLKNEIVQAYSQAADRFKTFSNYCFWLSGGALLLVTSFISSGRKLYYSKSLKFGIASLLVSILINLAIVWLDGLTYDFLYIELTEKFEIHQDSRKGRDWSSIVGKLQFFCIISIVFGVGSTLYFVIFSLSLG